MNFGSEIFIIPAIFIGLPWIIFHYVTKWKTAATITTDDEMLLEELHAMARRLDERMETIERIVAADNPDWQPTARLSSAENHDLGTYRQLDELRKEKENR